MTESSATETVAAAEPGKPASKKKLIIIIVAILLVIGATVGGLFAAGILHMPGHKTEVKEGEGEEATAEGEGHDQEGGEEKAEGSEHGAKGKDDKAEKSGSGNFYELPNMIVNLTGDNGKQRFLKINITLELNKKSDSKIIEAVLPRVTDHFQTYLRELRFDDLRGSAGLYRLRQELLDRVHSASGVDVKDVLFEEILVQ